MSIIKAQSRRIAHRMDEFNNTRKSKFNCYIDATRLHCTCFNYYSFCRCTDDDLPYDEWAYYNQPIIIVTLINPDEKMIKLITESCINHFTLLDNNWYKTRDNYKYNYITDNMKNN